MTPTKVTFASSLAGHALSLALTFILISFKAHALMHLANSRSMASASARAFAGVVAPPTLIQSERWTAAQSAARRSLASSPLFLFPCDALSSIVIATDTSQETTDVEDVAAKAILEDTSAVKSFAEALGYLVGTASLLLYTPIAVRIVRTKNAAGLAASTWWLKLVSFTLTDLYNIKRGFPISAFSESLIITLEAAVVLSLVTYYQNRMNNTFFLLAGVYLLLTALALLSSDEWISAAQVFATILSTSALLPQIKQNFDRGESGDYSPVTLSLASVGCTIRLFTTVQLADGDALLLLNYGVALLLNLTVLSQVIYFGTQKEKKSLATLFLADIR